MCPRSPSAASSTAELPSFDVVESTPLSLPERRTPDPNGKEARHSGQKNAEGPLHSLLIHWTWTRASVGAARTTSGHSLRMFDSVGYLPTSIFSCQCPTRLPATEVVCGGLNRHATTRNWQRAEFVDQWSQHVTPPVTCHCSVVYQRPCNIDNQFQSDPRV